MTFLLDVNVLISLFDTSHVAHEAAHIWFERTGRFHWATCPITENGLVRIIGHAKYPNRTGAPGDAVRLLAEFKQNEGHEFWSDDISIGDTRYIHQQNLLTPGQVTDTYLLALCVNKGGELATFDRRLTTIAVRNGERHLQVIKNSS